MPGTSSARAPSDSTAAQNTLAELCDTLRTASAEVAWRQWSAIGGMAATERRAASLVDPEALVLLSLVLDATEPRLADILASWAALNSDLLSVQRMRNLVRRYPAETGERLAGFARVAFDEGKDHRWMPLLRDGAPPLAHRGNKVRAVRVPPAEPAALVLRLRLAFGVGIKADVLGFLLGAEQEVWASTSTIATATGYTVAAVRKAINDLAEARLIHSFDASPTAYVAPRAQWRAFLETELSSRWRGWSERFVFIAAFLDWATKARERHLTPYVLDSRGRQLIAAHAASFRWQNVWPVDRELSGPMRSGVLSSAVHALAAWMTAEA
jgi:hypothetical protein